MLHLALCSACPAEVVYGLPFGATKEPVGKINPDGNYDPQGEM